MVGSPPKPKATDGKSTTAGKKTVRLSVPQKGFTFIASWQNSIHGYNLHRQHQNVFACSLWQPGAHGQLSKLDKKPPQLLKRVNLKSLCIAVTHPLHRDDRLLLPPCLHAVPLLVLHPFTPPQVRHRYKNQDLTPDCNLPLHSFVKKKKVTQLRLNLKLNHCRTESKTRFYCEPIDI